MDIQFSAYGLALIPAITALVEIAKRSGMPDRIAPLLALVLGLAAGLVYVAPDDWRAAILAGLVMGLSSMGLWSGGKTAVKAVQSDAS